MLSDLILPGATTAGGSDTYTAPAYMKGLHFTIDYFKPYLPPREIVVTDPLGNRLPHGGQEVPRVVHGFHHP